MNNEDTISTYVDRLKPLLHLAHRAYGPKDQDTPAHQASREYTSILKEFHESGGSLIDLSKALGVSYSGLRRRVFTSDVPSLKQKTSGVKLSHEQIEEAIARVKEAKATNTMRYHEQLAIEYYENGVSLTAIAKGLNLTNAGPLYYGVQRYTIRAAKHSAFQS